jgi:Zn2+/Cd2+-exporting ATPase
MSESIRTDLILEGLDCSNCALRIEDKVGKLEHVMHASVNFATKTLSIQTSAVGSHVDVLAGIRQIIGHIEPDVVVREKPSRVMTSIESTSSQESTNLQSALHGLGKAGMAKLGAGLLLFLAGIMFRFSEPLELGIFLAAYLLVGADVLVRAAQNILRGQVFDEHFLMGIATIGAFAIRQYPEAVAVMLFFQIGSVIQGAAVDHSRKSISALLDIRPDYANVMVGDDLARVPPGQVDIETVIVIRPGEKVPLDGKVCTGNSNLDTSAITGEPIPREVGPGDEILSGTINLNGLLTVLVTKTYGESTVSKILELVQNANGKKAPTENFISKFARYYTPVVVFIALFLAVVPPLAISGENFSDWIYRALVFLVVSCPCALVISIPLGFFGGIGGASKHGILIKGGNYLEALDNVDTVVFDKTGTLTKGVFAVTGIHSTLTEMGEEPFDGNASPIDGYVSPTVGNASPHDGNASHHDGNASHHDGNASPHDGNTVLLETAAYAESFSTHPIALSIIRAYGRKVDRSFIEEHEEIPGHGTKVRAGGKEILAGNEKLMLLENISFQKPDDSGTIVHLAVDGIYAGYLVISDEIKEDSARAVRQLRRAGVRRLVMLTGDSLAAGKAIGDQLGLDSVYTGLLPHQKVEMLEMLEGQRQAKGKLVFVGDGINDAPVLTRADVGIAMGGLGSDAAIEAADIVIMTDEPSKVASAIKIAKFTKRIVWQNILFAFAVKAIVLLLGAGGLATMWEAVFADMGVALVAIFNAMRVLHVKNVA